LKNLPCPAEEVISHFQHDEAYALLDSCGKGRFSILGFSPFSIVEIKDGKGFLTIQNQKRELKDPLTDFSQYYHSFSHRKLPFPFAGGGIGYFSYDLNRYFERLPEQATDDLHMPDLYFAFYDLFLVYDLLSEQTSLVYTGDSPRSESDIENVMERIFQTPIHNDENINTSDITLVSHFSRDTYIQAVSRIKEYIKEGEIYQANLSQRFWGACPVAPWTLYKKFRQQQPAEFSAYLKCGVFHIMSHSPERFIQVDSEGRILTQPIKGTCARSSGEDDEKRKQNLQSSEKDQAELLMIVDLERNDLGRICEIGSVETTELFGLKSLPHVHHLQATIQGNLKEGTNILDILRATFQGGSITGAPKIRAMEILEQIEPCRRGIYTGSIGYLSFSGELDLSIAIRTAIYHDKTLYFQVGGGIVWDSDPEAEYLETLQKGKFFMETLTQSNPKTSWATNYSMSL